MELFGHTKDVIRANYFYLMERMCPSKISDAHDIPIIINNYNRLTMLKKLIDSLPRLHEYRDSRQSEHLSPTAGVVRQVPV